MPLVVRVVVSVVLAAFVTSAVFLAMNWKRVSSASGGVTPTERYGGEGGARASFQGDPMVPAPGLETIRLPAFVLTDQHGKAFTEADFRGRVTVVNFMFTHCPFICPMLVQVMKQVAEDLKGTGVRLLSVSVDPEHDTPERLLAYAKEHEADRERWTFGVGTAEMTQRLIGDGFKFVVEADEKVKIDLPEGGKMSNIVHPSWLALVGPEGQVLQIAMSSNPEDVASMASRARAVDAKIKAAK